jgi:hypothetical protein
MGIHLQVSCLGAILLCRTSVLLVFQDSDDLAPW